MVQISLAVLSNILMNYKYDKLVTAYYCLKPVIFDIIELPC